MTFRIPGATYRLQLNRSFPFAEAAGLAGYLDALGITDLYVSPVFAAREGSLHGYDVIDPSVVNPELGGEAGLVVLWEQLRARGMGLLLDFVPNHMCVAGGTNRFWNDVLENGPSSPYARYFDIDWNPPKPDLAGKVLLPILGDQYGRVLERRELTVEVWDGAFRLRYYETVLPLAPESTIGILERALGQLAERYPEGLPGSALLESIVTGLRHLPARSEEDPELRRERNREKEMIKVRLSALMEESEPTRYAIRAALNDLNADDPQSFDRLDHLLSDQAYRLAFWRVASDEINYRRFFDVNELAAVRIEDPEVFEAFHETLFRLVKAGYVTGLRIDHVDGLFDPAGYLRAIHRGVGGGDNEIYLVVEKILAYGETIPADWPIHGTTGYDFLNLVGGVFVDRDGAQQLNEIYYQFSGQAKSFESLAYQCKKLVLRHSMSSQVAMLARRLDRISEQHRHSRDFTLQSLQEALVEILARFPVYRTYVTPGSIATEEDLRWIDEAVATAIVRNPATSPAHFEFVRQVLVGDDPHGLEPSQVAERRELVLSLQQLTGAVMAKAVEDTAFYRFFPLASRGEVGGTPDQPGVTLEQFHEHNQERGQSYPHSLLATTTHDTKRSEDVRARIRALSEMPDVWQLALESFRATNARHKTTVSRREAPDANEEYLLYQTLLGAWPFEEMSSEELDVFVGRVQAYMQKALREAKVNSSWLHPNQAWEGAVAHFVECLIRPSSDNEFLGPFLTLQRRAARIGVYGSLAQIILKVAAPGVPDFYQGNELWDLSLVDPDNRRPVDFDQRRAWLSALQTGGSDDMAALVSKLLQSSEDGRIKLWVTTRALRLRRSHADLFERGEYLPVGATGFRGDHVVAFARTLGEEVVIAVTGRLLLPLGADDAPPVGERVWGGTVIRVGDGLRRGTYRDALSGVAVVSNDQGELDLGRVFAVLPTALLEKIA